MGPDGTEAGIVLVTPGDVEGGWMGRTVTTTVRGGIPDPVDGGLVGGSAGFTVVVVVSGGATVVDVVTGAAFVVLVVGARTVVVVVTGGFFVVVVGFGLVVVCFGGHVPCVSP